MGSPVPRSGKKTTLWQAIEVVPEFEGGCMIKPLNDLPAGVIGFEVTGKIEAEDYRDVVLPALEQAAQRGEVRFMIVMPEFHGMSAGALWRDLKIGVEHFRAWKRIAVVTDVDWIH